jgi:hypothetical protein
MSLSNSSKMGDQLTMAFYGVMEEAMSMLQTEEVAATAASSSTRGPKRHRRYVNRDREAAHFMLRHDYFDNDCVFPVLLPPEVSYMEDSFSKHYA